MTQNLKLATLGWKEPINCCKTNFTKLFKQPWESMTVALIKTGFRKWGIFPLDRSAIDTSQQSGQSSNPPPPSTSSNPPPPPTSSNPPLPPSSNSNQTSTTSLIGDTSQEVNNACTSTPEHSVSSNLLVLSGIVPASLIESFIFPDINIKGKKRPRVNTKAHLITSNEHVQAYNNKIQKIRLEQEVKENWGKELEGKRLEGEQQGRKKKSRGFKRRGLNTRGRKVNVGPAKIPMSTRNIG